MSSGVGFSSPVFGINVTDGASVGILANAELPDCVNGPLKDNLVCDSTADYWDRATALVDLFTVEELVANMGNNAAGVSRLGLAPYNWWNEALHGVAKGHGVTFGNPGEEFSVATSFPQVIGLGATFDDPLVHEIATLISTEARAFANAKRGGLDYWTPNINPFRDPRWGRGQEVASEDAFHIASYVKALVTGLQGPDAPEYFKLVADCKHFLGYDLDNWKGPNGTINRYIFDAKITSQELAEYHLQPFRACVRDAQAGSVMCSYNSVNGIPACAHEYFLKDVLRDHLNFGDRNWVTGDCKAIEYSWSMHNYTSTLEEMTALALKAGSDTDCGAVFQSSLVGAYNNGRVTLDNLKQAVRRLYGSLIRTGYFDPVEKQPYASIGWKDVNTPEAQKLALVAAEKSFVLLKNDGLLPLSVEAYPNVALIGPEGNATTDMQGNYFGTPPYLVSPLDGLVAAGFNVSYQIGTDGIQGNATTSFQAAIDAATAADLIIFAGGVNNQVEKESQDRTSIAYPGNQLDLLRLLTALGKPVVVLQFGGGQVDDTELKANDAVNSILWVGFPGQSGGTAIANVVTGKTAPAGRLSTTQYPASFTSVPMTDMSLRPSEINPAGRTYQWYTGGAVYPFGYGLHYTTFKNRWALPVPPVFSIALLAQKHTKKYLDTEVFHTFKVVVSNTGKVTSDYVALLFSSTTAGPQPAPIKSLVSYARARDIAPGKSTVVNLEVSLGSIARADDNGRFILYPGKYKVALDNDASLVAEFLLVGKPTQILDFPQPRSTEPAA